MDINVALFQWYTQVFDKKIYYAHQKKSATPIETWFNSEKRQLAEELEKGILEDFKNIKYNLPWKTTFGLLIYQIYT